jgi:anthranilate synthase/aminodeoxychorismate synthase-like glutamine amidotransferase
MRLEEPTNGTPKCPNAMAGKIPLLNSTTDRPPLRWSAETWHVASWQPTPTVVCSGHTLADALRSVAKVAEDLAPGSPVSTHVSALPLSFSGSAIAGLLYYDLVQWTEPLHLQNVASPNSLLGTLYRIDRWLVHDREQGLIRLCAPYGDPWARRVEEWLNKNVACLEPLALCQHAAPSNGESSVESAINDQSHAEAIHAVQRLIRAGQLYQLNFGRQWTGHLHETPWQLMRRLFVANAAPYSAFLQVPDAGLAVCSSSPEMLVEVKGRLAGTCPIKGTCARGKCKEEDEALRNEMIASRKECAEHLMLVDLERHDLGRICLPGSVHWKYWRVETFPNVQHMVSRVEGCLQPEADAWDTLSALFPGGSITGCPKTATISAIDELEQQCRSGWTGSIGYVDLRTGSSSWNILIRTLEAHLGSDGVGWLATVKAGGGLTIGSEAKAEIEEAKLKAHKLLDIAFARRGVGGNGQQSSRNVSDSLEHHPISPLNHRVGGLLAGLEENSRNGVACLGSWHFWKSGAPPMQPVTCMSTQSKLPRSCRVLFVDNLDSFSLNIANACAKLGAEVVIVSGRNNDSDMMEQLLATTHPTHVLLGPGPGRPEMYPLTMCFAQAALCGKLGLPLLGVCLGHQALARALGWDIVESPLGPVHGVPEHIYHDGKQLFKDLPNPACMVRYNSLVVQKPSQEDVGTGLQDVAWDDTKTLIMGLRHAAFPVCGVQFHPESAGSHGGRLLFRAFLELG